MAAYMLICSPSRTCVQCPLLFVWLLFCSTILIPAFAPPPPVCLSCRSALCRLQPTCSRVSATPPPCYYRVHPCVSMHSGLMTATPRCRRLDVLHDFLLSAKEAAVDDTLVVLGLL